MIKIYRTYKNASTWQKCAALAKMPLYDKNVPLLQKWLNIVKMCRTSKNSSIW